MKRICFILCAIAVSVACERAIIEEDIDIANVKSEDVDEMLAQCDKAIDGKRVWEAITTNGIVIGDIFECRGGEWYDVRFVPGAFAVYGCVVEDDTCKIYGETEPTGVSMGGFVCNEYDCDYDEASATLLTDSWYHNFQYAAKVVYFNGDTIIFDGVLGCHDFMNNDYASRRYVYMCTLDSEAPANWEKLLDELTIK